MNILTQSNFDRFCKHCYGYCIGLSVVLMVMSTCALIGNCVPTFGNITRINEIVYDKCLAEISYENYDGKKLHTALQLPCPRDIQNYQDIIMLSYSLWDNNRVSIGWPWITYNQAIDLYKSGLFIFFVTAPYYIYLHFIVRESDDNTI